MVTETVDPLAGRHPSFIAPVACVEVASLAIAKGRLQLTHIGEPELAAYCLDVWAAIGELLQAIEARESDRHRRDRVAEMEVNRMEIEREDLGDGR